jgi:hypothetical protein
MVKKGYIKRLKSRGTTEKKLTDQAGGNLIDGSLMLLSANAAALQPFMVMAGKHGTLILTWLMAGYERTMMVWLIAVHVG